MRPTRRGLALLVFLTLAVVLGGCGSGSGNSSSTTPTLEAIPATEAPTPIPAIVRNWPRDTFKMPKNPPAPVPLRDVKGGCKFDACTGGDPHVAGCDTGEGNLYQDKVEIKNTQRTVVATLLLRGNDGVCGSAQWATLTGIKYPMDAAVRVVQDGTGKSTPWIIYTGRDEDFWSPMLSSPGPRVRAEFALVDSQGNVELPPVVVTLSH